MASSEARKQTFCWESPSEDEKVTSPTSTSSSFQATTTFQSSSMLYTHSTKSQQQLPKAPRVSAAISNKT